MEHTKEPDGERIVLCVNALAGVRLEEGARVQELLEAAEHMLQWGFRHVDHVDDRDYGDAVWELHDALAKFGVKT